MFRYINNYANERRTRKKALYYLLFSARQHSEKASPKDGMAKYKNEIRFAYKSSSEYVKVCSNKETHPITDLLACLVALTTIKMLFDSNKITQNNLRNSLIRLTTVYRMNYCSLPQVDLSSPQDSVTNNRIEDLVSSIKAALNDDEFREKHAA